MDKQVIYQKKVKIGKVTAIYTIAENVNNDNINDTKLNKDEDTKIQSTSS